MKILPNTIVVNSVHALEENDLFAYASTGLVWSGRVVRVVYTGNQLDEITRAYMSNKGLDIPEDKFHPVGGERQYLIFFMEHHKMQHIYLDWDTPVAIFPKEA